MLGCLSADRAFRFAGTSSARNRRNPLRCQRMSVSCLTTTKALRQSNHWLSQLIDQRVESRRDAAGHGAPGTRPIACAKTGSRPLPPFAICTSVRPVGEHPKERTVRIKCRDAFNQSRHMNVQDRTTERP